MPDMGKNQYPQPKALRLLAPGMGVTELARKVRPPMQPAHLSRILNGITDPQMATLKRIAKAIGKRPDDVVTALCS
jgi:transcriptional regulator with XRE-family HTH domain